MAQKRKTPAVRMAKPTGRPIQLRYTDPTTGKEVRISTGVYDPEEAEELKDELEAKLLLGIDAKPRARKRGGPAMSWEEFRHRHLELHLSTLRPKSRKDAGIRLDIVEKILKPRLLADVADSEALQELQNKLLAGANSRHSRPRSPHTVQTYMAIVFGALNWAAQMGWLKAVPRIRKVKTSKLRHMKGRPITREEFERMLTSVPKVVGKDKAVSDSWKYLLRGLWESGLRLDELMHVSWDDPSYILPDWSRGQHAELIIPAAMQKNDTEEAIPLLDGFSDLLLETPEASRSGWVFTPLSLQTKQGRQPRHGRPTAEWVGKVITRIGSKAKVVVVPAVGIEDQPGYKPPKFASAHDLRRSFADRLVAAGVSERDVAAVMRHASVETTRRHYAPRNVQRSAAAIRGCLRAAGGSAVQPASGRSEEPSESKT